ncbi:MAG: hypothetical protein HY722_05940 [Planctomycetes bacterium]|nr:hypothetical protein [Planctomycetota bacterium]
MARTQAGLPGADLLTAGLADLARRRETAAALLVAIGAPRLRAQGIALPPPEALPSEPERRLYRHLAALHGDDAHGRYNALIRRLVSCERSLEATRGRVQSG